MKKIFAAVVFAAATLACAAQQFDYTLAQGWSDRPVLHTVSKPFDSAAAVCILDQRKIEYRNEKDNMYVYVWYHRIIKIMSDKGIEMFNKVYIPIYANAEMQEVMARSISAGGKITNVDPSAIKEIEEDDQQYKLFAIDGVEKNAEVEYAYKIKRRLSLFGSEVFQRTNMPCLQAQFTLVTPDFLKFDAKGFNGFTVSKDSVIADQRVIAGYSVNIPEMDDEEKYSFTDPYLQRVDYKLSYNMSKNPGVRLYTWKEFAKEAWDVYTSRSEKENKALDAFIKQIKLPSSDDAAKILTIEDYIKQNINIDKDLIAGNGSSIDAIVKNKAADDDGISRLFAGIFDKLGISYQLVFPGDRTGFQLDEELENWNRAGDVLFYFAATGKYISPVRTDLRYPYFPYQFAGTRGLFLKGTTIGTFTSAIASWNEVKIIPFEEHAINMEADVQLNETMDTLIINSKQILKGYGATQFRPIYTFLTKEKQDEANREIIKNAAGSEDISNITVQNPALTDYFDNKPLIIGADIKSTELLERAGNKILFKLGEIIGPQVQMYQEKPRQLPAEIEFPHVLQRTITFHIPEGYVVKNLSDINMDVEHKEDGKTTMGFISSYKQDGNKITVFIDESYHEIKYPLSQFEDFKKVINASADWNKVVLVLEKK